MQKYGIYIIKEKFFEDFPDENLKENKESNRPCYYAIEDGNGLIWFIPMSTKVEKIKAKIKEKEDAGKRCDVFYVAKLFGKESAFIIGDMFPVLQQYIERAYTISGQVVVLKNRKMISEVDKRATRVLNLIRRCIKLHDKQPNVLEIEKKLLEMIDN